MRTYKLLKEHPEIFGDETLKPKEKGRNNDMSKEFFIRCKQKQFEKLQAEIEALETEKETIISTQKMMIEETQKLMDSSINQVVDSEMKKEFMQYAMLDHPRTSIGKIVTSAFRKFREWWEIYRKPKVTHEVRESVLKRLKQNQEAIESAHAMLDNKNKSKEYER